MEDAFPPLQDSDIAGFVSDLRGLQRSSVVHLFKRDYLYCCYGEQAMAVAKIFFETTSVVRKDGSVQHLDISRSILSRLLEYCCDNQIGMCIWLKQNSVWVPSQRCIPGYLAQVEEYLGSSADSIISKHSCASIHYNASTYSVGLAICNVSVGDMILFNFIDNCDFELLDSVLGQYSPKSCFIANADGNAASGVLGGGGTVSSKVTTSTTGTDSGFEMPVFNCIKKILLKHNIYISLQNMEIFSVPSNQLQATLQAILSVKVSSSVAPHNEIEDVNSTALNKNESGNIDSVAQSLGTMSECIIAVRALLSVIGQWDMINRNYLMGKSVQQSEIRGANIISYVINIGHMKSILNYDQVVSKALSIFPEGKQGKRNRESNDKSNLSSGNAFGDSTGLGLGVDDYPMEEVDTSPFSHSRSYKFESLYELLNQTTTRGGSRLLYQWLQRPLRDFDKILERQYCVESFVGLPSIRNEFRQERSLLRNFPDMEMLVKKLQQSKGNILWNLLLTYRAIFRITSISHYFDDCIKKGDLETTEFKSQFLPFFNIFSREFSRHESNLKGFMSLVESVIDIDGIIEKSMGSSSNGNSDDNGLGDALKWSSDQKWLRIRASFDPELQRLHDKLKSLRDSIGEDWTKTSRAINGGEEQEVQSKSKATAASKGSKAGSAGSKSIVLHLENSPIHGIHYRLTKKDAIKGLPKLNIKTSGLKGSSNPSTIILAALKAGTMFRTSQLDRLVRQYEQLCAEYNELQLSIVTNTRIQAMQYSHHLISAARSVSAIDLYCTLAHVATLYDWCKPTIFPESENNSSHSMASTDIPDSSGGSNRNSIEISDLRHASLSPYLGSKYVTSDVSLIAKRIAIITGPNMGGKSTYLRALGQCVILAHIGSYVPASKASIKIVDSIFARVGASDSLDAGVSTFMAEMLEMSHILRSCTSNSLLLIDELGRGTSTEEGFGIAYAIVEKLARDIKPFVALATHFHELTYIENAYDNIQNVHVDTAITSTTSSKSVSIPSICMLYKVVPGVSYSSFGINVAKLAGFPSSIISEAESLLNVLDEHTDIRRGAWEGPVVSASVTDDFETQGASKKRREA